MATSKNGTQTAPARRATIRMYRLGVGDCFLVSFPRPGLADYRILIDCGVHQAQPKGSERIKESYLGKA